MLHSLLYRSSRVFGLTALAVLLTAGTAFAQASRVEGTVRNAQTRDPVPNARVTIVGTNLFAMSNDNGYYAIESVAVGTYDVRVQVIGFQSVIFTNQRVAAGLPTTVNFELQPSILRIEGVVVTGVAEATQAVKLPFTVSQIQGEDLPVAQQSAEESIRGKVAGARVVRGRGTPGTGVTVLLRGATSLNTSGRSNEPLYVVDGVILGASMVDVDALDIANIEVVKGASAAALYGSRAANGVVSITTRRGSAVPEGETRINFSSHFGRNDLENPIAQAQAHWFEVGGGRWLGTVDDPADCTAASYCQVTGGDSVSIEGSNRALASRDVDEGGVEFRSFVETVRDSTDHDGDGTFSANSYVLSDNPFPGTTFDNLDRFFNPGSFYTNTLGVSHRTGNTNFRASVHETKESGIVEGLNGYIRRGARLNVDHRIGRAFDFSASAYYSQSERDDPQESNGAQAFYGLNFYPIDVDLLELEGTNNDNAPRDVNDFLIDPDPAILEENPIYSARNQDNTDDRGRFLGSLGIRWRPTDVFDVQGEFSYDRSDRGGTDYFFRGFKTIGSSSVNDGLLRKTSSFDQALNGSLSATANKPFGDLNTITKVRVLIERAKGEFFSSEARDVTVDLVKDLDVGNPNENRISSNSDEIRSLGYFLSSQLDYKDRYIFDGLIRRDGSSLFGKDERWNWYYRVSGAWRISQEPFWNVSWLNELKLRFSRGTAGGRPRFSAQYETFTVSGGAVGKGNLGNNQLKPELATENELGLDMIFGGRMSLALTYVDHKVEDQLLLVPLVGYFGFSNQWQNAGTVEGTTWEGTLQWAVIQSPTWNWNMHVIFDRTRQKITDFNLPAYRDGPASAWYIREGEELGTLYGDRWTTQCSELRTDGGLGVAAACSQFQLNDDGYLVPVGTGNTYQDGINQNFYGSKITIDGREFNWGMPVRAQEEQRTTLADGSVFTDTTEFLALGRTTPDYGWGFGNTIRFKSLSLYFLVDAQIGGEIYNNTRQWANRDNNAWETDQLGKAEGDKKPLLYYQTLYNVNAINSHYAETGTFTKLRELALTYTFNRGALEGVLGGFFSRISLSLVGRNLLTFTDYTGYDPEVSEGGNQAIYRWDGFEYPNYRTFTGGIEIEF